MDTDLNRTNGVIVTLADIVQNRLSNLCPPMRLPGRLAARPRKSGGQL